MIIKVNNFDEALSALEAHKRKLAEVGYDIADGILQDEVKVDKNEEELIPVAMEFLAKRMKELAVKEGWEYIPVYLTFEENEEVYIFAVGIIIQHEHNKADVDAKIKEAKLREQEEICAESNEYVCISEKHHILARVKEEDSVCAAHVFDETLEQFGIVDECGVNFEIRHYTGIGTLQYVMFVADKQKRGCKAVYGNTKEELESKISTDDIIIYLGKVEDIRTIEELTMDWKGEHDETRSEES